MGSLAVKFAIFLIIILYSTLAECYRDSTPVNLEREKRYLDFLRSSRIFFRVNVRNNILDVNTLFAYAFGYRSNYPIENGTTKRKAMKRDVYRILEKIIEEHGFDGKACILKSYCTVVLGAVNDRGGMLFKIFEAFLKRETHKLKKMPAHFLTCEESIALGGVPFCCTTMIHISNFRAVWSISYVIYIMELLTNKLTAFIAIVCAVLVECRTESAPVKLERGKRYLYFLPSTRVFFRANVKNNLLDVNALFAYAFGYKANYPIENGTNKNKAMKREVYRFLEKSMEHHGFDGKACVLKSYCAATVGLNESKGMLSKILTNIFT